MKKVRILSLIFIILFSGLFVFSAYKITSYYYELYVSKKTYNSVANEVIIKQDNVSEEKENSNLFDVDFETLRSKNSDVVGWIYLPNTPINYPVLQGDTNNQYLRRLLDGSYNQDGSIFVDYRNAELKTDMNYIIYGHNMKSGTMFTSLENYKTQEFYEQNPVIYYFTPECKYILNLYAGFVASTDSETFEINSDEDDFLNYMNDAKNNSTFSSNVEYTQGETVVTLSTCYSKDDRYRYVVLGILEEYNNY